MELLVIVQICT